MQGLKQTSCSYRMEIAGCELRCRFVFPDTALHFGSYIVSDCQGQGGISVPAAEWDSWIRGGGIQEPYAEYTSFTACTSDALLAFDRMIIHGVALRFRDRAWLICGESGVGKSTQVRCLQELYPGEFSVICGDRTVLDVSGDGVIAHPSPWNGKENWHGAQAAPLAGILCLERGEETQILPYTPDRAIVPVLRCLISTYSSETVIRSLAGFETKLLYRAPVWRYVNGGVPDSCRVLYETLLIRED